MHARSPEKSAYSVLSTAGWLPLASTALQMAPSNAAAVFLGPRSGEPRHQDCKLSRRDRQRTGSTLPQCCQGLDGCSGHPCQSRTRRPTVRQGSMEQIAFGAAEVAQAVRWSCLQPWACHEPASPAAAGICTPGWSRWWCPVLVVPKFVACATGLSIGSRPAGPVGLLRQPRQPSPVPR